jgi:hypothetical protein
MINILNKIVGKQNRKKETKCHFGDDDILIENYRLNAVHYMPAKVEKGLELDFYMNTGNDIYMLRLQNIPDNVIIFITREIVSKKIIPFTYIIIRKILSSNINKELEIAVKRLQMLKFPEYDEERTIEIEKWE